MTIISILVPHIIRSIPLSTRRFPLLSHFAKSRLTKFQFLVCYHSPYTSFKSMADGEGEMHMQHSPTVEKLEMQFEELRSQLEDSGKLRERIRAVAMEIESTTWLMHSSVLLIHHSISISDVIEKAKQQIGGLRELYNKLAEIIRECPDQYYRYHGDWRTETQTVVSLLSFIHWLETGTLLLHTEAEAKLGLNPTEFGLDVEDYLIGICFMSNELPRYVVNQVTAGDYECPRKVLKFLKDLHAAFRMLNLRNDFLRKKFDGMKYDLRRVEEVFYDVKIRGLATNGESAGKEGDQGQS
ncbi:translin isoform X2 [Olea europaea var. sylvestris]|uniref:translin isoform X2 n=1 Tax=Olea europaea var. sylvestris TaxID=158386 RepID=UPI000C1D487D|nr:translin isoform X2 [Olea europaea var. sylvestris]